MRVLDILLPCLLVLLEIAHTLIAKKSPESVWSESQHKPYDLVIGECWIFLLEPRADLPSFSRLSAPPLYSRPAGISIIHRSIYLSVLSNAQIIHYESNGLSNVQIEFKKPSDVVYQDAFNNSSVGNGYGRAVGFRCPSHVYQNSRRLKVHLYLRIVKKLLMAVRLQSRRTSTFHCCEPRRLRLLFSLAFHFYDIYINACLFPDNPHSRATLLQVMSRQSLFRSHDFAVYLCKMCCRLQYSPSPVLRNIIHLCFVMRAHFKLPPRTFKFYLQKYRLSRGLGLPSKMLRISNTQLFTAAHVHHSSSSSPAPRGGGASRLLNWTIVEPHALSNPRTADSQSRLRYIAHVEGEGLTAYPPDIFVHARIPLPIISHLLSITVVREIAAALIHGVTPGSRCTVAQLRSCMENHECKKCSTYITIFAVEKSAEKKSVDRATKSKAKATELRKEKEIAMDGDTVFPPEPAGMQLEHDIIRDACRRMHPSNIEELGCAVCGELKLRKDTSRLKSVKKILKVLETSGVTRQERSTSTSPIKEFKGPVLDYSCSAICNDCRGCVRKGKIPRLALANGLWIGKVPDVLKDLSFVEKLLVARVRHTCAFVKVASGMRKMKANIVAFESPIPKIYNMLPPPREDLDEALAILFTGPCKPTAEDFARTPFLVRRNAVIKALEWLKLNHANYADLEISYSNAMQYGDGTGMPPVSIEYRPSATNKVPEGTSVHDNLEEDGTVEGQCSFTVHGLTGEAYNLMTPNALKAMALRHLNSGGKVLAVGHSNQLQSMWNNPELYPQMFPWLFPYGMGGIGSTHISHKEHKRHLLMYHDKRFQTDINFPFVAFSHEQMMANTTQSFLLADQQRFGDISHRLMNIDWPTLDDLIKRLEAGEHINVAVQNDAEKQCFQLIHDLDAVSGRMHGSTTSKKYMRNEIWSMINHIGSPSWYITLSPADIQHPISIYFASTNDQFRPDLPSYDERARLVCENPVAGARFFDFMVRTFIEDVLGVGNTYRDGFYGPTSGYYGTVEQQGRLTLHLHMLLWIKGNLNPEDLRAKIMSEDSAWRQKIIAWLESCHTGDFLTGSHAAVIDKNGILKNDPTYIDPTMTMPVPPPIPCRIHVESDAPELCISCKVLADWNKTYRTVTDDLLLRSNVHSCTRGNTKDGTRRKKKTYAGCMDNKWGKCKARFPRPTAVESSVDDTGAITMKKKEPWINTFTPLVTFILRCNTDITSLASGTAIKGVIMYVSDYITKSTLKTHVIFDSIRTVFQRNGEMIGGSLPTKEKARRFMTKVANLLRAKAEMGSPMIAMYLLGNPDHYTSHTFVLFYWHPYVTEARRPFETEGSNASQGLKVTVIKKKGRVMGLSPVHDYVYRPKELGNVNLYEWIRCYKREKKTKKKTKTNSSDDIDDTGGMEHSGWQEENHDSPDVSLDVPNQFDTKAGIDSDDESDANEESHGQYQNRLLNFQKEHPLADSHGIRYVKDNASRIPNFVGKDLPRCDKGDREFYCSTMLTLFKPWRKGEDLKSVDMNWDEAFQIHPFSEKETRYMRNFNVRYECLDARDDYRAQMKKSEPTITGSWNVEDEDDVEVGDNLGHGGIDPENVELDDAPFGPFLQGPKHKKRMKETESVRQMMCNMGWADPLDRDHTVTHWRPESFIPEKTLSGAAWEQAINTLKKTISDKKNEYNILRKPEQDDISPHTLNPQNIVKIVDKSYLDSKFYVDGASDLIDSTVEKFTLNKEQECAFRIITNHAVSKNPEQLRMNLGGMGGTGKSQVIKALSHFFTSRNEAHRFIIVAPTGSAAALLGGSTYHSMFGINDKSGNSRIGHVKEKMEGVQYIFFDEVSMLSARDLYRIHVQLAKVFDCAHVPFGNLNMVFSGDFAQLPPALGGENVSLYSRTIGSLSTDIKSQEEAVGKALWHQITTVVILRENMRQKHQSLEDAQFRTALENMRFKACTPEDIIFLRTLISSKLPGHSSVCDEDFRNVSIITGTNLHKDEINRLGAIRFAQETGQSLVDFYSDDSPCGTHTDTEKVRGVKHVGEISDEMRDALWSQPPSSSDKHIAGKLSICIGLPVMIRYNYATEICMTRGQEGFVQGWQSKKSTNGQVVLDTLFVKLKDPPIRVQVPGLPENVVPVYPTTNNMTVSLPNDEKYLITRTQVEVLVNFAMTDFASQGKTRPKNVSDPNNLRSHQSYYTSLSRSSTAAGTLILQGFDPRQITGGCSGALRQEFRELELLDEITRLRYLGKLPITVDGDTRNNIITSFRSWKGEQYVPKNVHTSIRWSKRNPWLDSQNLDLNERLALLEQQKEKKKAEKKGNNLPSSLSKTHRDRNSSLDISKIRDKSAATGNLKTNPKFPNTGKRRRSSGIQRRVSHDFVSVQSGPKRKYLQVPLPHAEHYVTPIGCRWSENSCAYDVIVTPMFLLWCSDRDKWSQEFRRTRNAIADMLIEGFCRYERGETSLEGARDDFRRLIASMPNTAPFGNYTTIESVCIPLLRSNSVISEMFYQCSNGHYVHYLDDHDAFFSTGRNEYESIAQWISLDTRHIEIACQHCGHAVGLQRRFRSAPPLLVFSIPTSNSTTHINTTLKISIEDQNHKYLLTAVVYYGNHHFTNHIITRDGRIWFYDGMAILDRQVRPALECVGSINSQQDSDLLYNCRGNNVCAVIYAHQLE